MKGCTGVFLIPPFYSRAGRLLLELKVYQCAFNTEGAVLIGNKNLHVLNTTSNIKGFYTHYLMRAKSLEA